jgi:hypothetical protein
MTDKTQTRSQTMVERAVAMIEQQQTVSNEPLPSARTASQARSAAQSHAPARPVPHTPHVPHVPHVPHAPLERREHRERRELRSPWPARIAGFAAVFGIGMGIGNWLGNSAQAGFSASDGLAQTSSIYSLPADPPLRIDYDFSNIQPHRR